MLVLYEAEEEVNCNNTDTVSSWMILSRRVEMLRWTCLSVCCLSACVVCAPWWEEEKRNKAFTRKSPGPSTWPAWKTYQAKRPRPPPRFHCLVWRTQPLEALYDTRPSVEWRPKTIIPIDKGSVYYTVYYYYNQLCTHGPRLNISFYNEFKWMDQGVQQTIVFHLTLITTITIQPPGEKNPEIYTRKIYYACK